MAPVDTIGSRLAHYLLAPRHAELRRTLTVLVRATDHEAVRVDLQTTMRRLLVDKLVRRMTGEDAVVRAWLVSAQMLGLMQSWDMVGGDGVAADERRRVADLYGTAIQALITPTAS